jgi:hypothetical protein
MPCSTSWLTSSSSTHSTTGGAPPSASPATPLALLSSAPLALPAAGASAPGSGAKRALLPLLASRPSLEANGRPAAAAASSDAPVRDATGEKGPSAPERGEPPSACERRQKGEASRGPSAPGCGCGEWVWAGTEARLAHAASAGDAHLRAAGPVAARLCGHLQARADAGEELLPLEGLGDVVVCWGEGWE